mmetsp:Transcript_43442/g.139624  ORF Transcript_43442/g.139624 Transcript_43442/m.139624 type:complete len:180 (-) Transcript_43442:58-597(-)
MRALARAASAVARHPLPLLPLLRAEPSPLVVLCRPTADAAARGPGAGCRTKMSGDSAAPAAASATASTAAAAASASPFDEPEERPLAALPDSCGGGAPVDNEERTLVVDGTPIKMDKLGPVVVNVDGTISRISNWHEMIELEQKNTMRIIGKRNQQRLAALRQQQEQQQEPSGGAAGEG